VRAGMSFEEFKKFWEFAREHPLSVALLLAGWSIALAVVYVAVQIGGPKLLALFQPSSPFASISGKEYVGEIHSSRAFTFCFEAQEKDPTSHQYDVRGTMSFPTGTYVDYWGNKLALSYRRMNSAVPDQGKAVFYAPSSKDQSIEGCYVSDDNPANRQDLKLTKIEVPRELKGWNKGL
jgi:hypothetical protein